LAFNNSSATFSALLTSRKEAAFRLAVIASCDFASCMASRAFAATPSALSFRRVSYAICAWNAVIRDSSLLLTPLKPPPIPIGEALVFLDEFAMAKASGD